MARESDLLPFLGALRVMTPPMQTPGPSNAEPRPFRGPQKRPILRPQIVGTLGGKVLSFWALATFPQSISDPTPLVSILGAGAAPWAAGSDAAENFKQGEEIAWLVEK